MNNYSIWLFLLCKSVFAKVSLSPGDLNNEWQDYKREFNKTYTTSVENSKRFQIYMDNLQQIIQHNKEYKRGNVSFALEPNQFTDMRADEVMSTYAGLGTSSSMAFDTSHLSTDENFIQNIPESLNWKTLGAVTPVRNQGACGACWAFAAIGALEGQQFLATNHLTELSEQQIIDCSLSFGNQGCVGGFIDKTYDYIKSNHGIDSNEAYPYIGQEGSCKYNKTFKVTNDNGFIALPGNENYLKMAVANIGPISVLIDASHTSFQAYSHGVYFEPHCRPNHISHAALLVGYGRDERTNLEYWLVKNSWGMAWGDQGYIKMIRNHNNNCCIACAATYPIISN